MTADNSDSNQARIDANVRGTAEIAVLPLTESQPQ
jgi:hypothetical protein